MSTKLNFPDTIIEKMKEQLNETHLTRKEHGFNIYYLKDSYYPGAECKGTECEINFAEERRLLPRLLRRTPKVGDYHTHPDKDAIMSAGDMLRACLLDFACVGGTRENKIRCFIRKESYKKPFTSPLKESDQQDECRRDADKLYNIESHLRYQLKNEENNIKSLENKLRSDMISSNEKEKLTKQIRDHGKKLENCQTKTNRFNKELRRFTDKYFSTIEIYDKNDIRKF